MSTRHKHNIIHGHTKPTKNETRKVPAGDKVGIATHNNINDLVNVSGLTNVIMFADDTNLFSFGDDLAQLA